MFLSRVQGLLLRPRHEWPRIAAEPATAAGLLAGWVLPLALIPGVFAFVGLVLLAPVPVGPGPGLLVALVAFALTPLSVAVVARVVAALAPAFGARRNGEQAMKVSAYACTPSCVAGIGAVLPPFGALLSLAGLVYGLYLLHLGLRSCMQAPDDSAAGYTAAVAAIVLGLAVGVALVLDGITVRATLAGFGEAAR